MKMTKRCALLLNILPTFGLFANCVNLAINLEDYCAWASNCDLWIPKIVILNLITFEG